MTYYAALDVSLRSVAVCIIDEKGVSGASTPPGFQLEAGVMAQGISASMSEAGCPAAMASSVALR